MWTFEASFNTQRNYKKGLFLLLWLPNVQVSVPVGGNTLGSKGRQSDGQEYVELVVAD